MMRPRTEASRSKSPDPDVISSQIHAIGLPAGEWPL
jgi:hypothetical protein